MKRSPEWKCIVLLLALSASSFWGCSKKCDQPDAQLKLYDEVLRSGSIISITGHSADVPLRVQSRIGGREAPVNVQTQMDYYLEDLVPVEYLDSSGTIFFQLQFLCGKNWENAGELRPVGYDLASPILVLQGANEDRIEFESGSHVDISDSRLRIEDENLAQVSVNGVPQGAINELSSDLLVSTDGGIIEAQDRAGNYSSFTYSFSKIPPLQWSAQLESDYIELSKSELEESGRVKLSIEISCEVPLTVIVEDQKEMLLPGSQQFFWPMKIDAEMAEKLYVGDTLYHDFWITVESREPVQRDSTLLTTGILLAFEAEVPKPAEPAKPLIAEEVSEPEPVIEPELKILSPEQGSQIKVPRGSEALALEVLVEKTAEDLYFMGTRQTVDDGRVTLVVPRNVLSENMRLELQLQDGQGSVLVKSYLDLVFIFPADLSAEALSELYLEKKYEELYSKSVSPKQESANKDEEELMLFSAFYRMVVLAYNSTLVGDYNYDKFMDDYDFLLDYEKKFSFYEITGSSPILSSLLAHGLNRHSEALKIQLRRNETLGKKLSDIMDYFEIEQMDKFSALPDDQKTVHLLELAFALSEEAIALDQTAYIPPLYIGSAEEFSQQLKNLRCQILKDLSSWYSTMTAKRDRLAELKAIASMELCP
jgi:hypothetical protein